MKKVTALFLAMLMCMALTVPALGVSVSSGSDKSGTVTYVAKVQEPTISVTVPSASRAVVLNPYKISVSATATSVASGDIATTLGADGTSSNSIIASKLYLYNMSTVPLKMSMTLKGTASSTVAFSATSLANATTEKNKKVFIFAEVGATTADTVTDAPAAEISNVTYSSTNPKQGVFKNGELKMTEVAIIPVSGNLANTPPTGNWTPISLGGDCTTSPTTPWGENDKVDISIFFSFQAADTTVSGG